TTASTCGVCAGGTGGSAAGTAAIPELELIVAKCTGAPRTVPVRTGNDDAPVTPTVHLATHSDHDRAGELPRRGGEHGGERDMWPEPRTLATRERPKPPTLKTVSIAPMGSPGAGMRVCTRPIPALDRPIELLPDEHGPLCWVRGSQGLVGWGEAARFACKGPDRFRDADEWWRQFVSGLDIVDELQLPGTGAVAFASFAFASAPGESVLVVPRVLVGTRDGIGWITEIGTGDAPPRMQPVTPVRPPTGIRYGAGRLPVERWRQAVVEAVRRMRRGELYKAVFAHDLLATADAPLDPRFLLSGLAERYPTCWSFA